MNWIVRRKKITDDSLMHHGVKGQEWGKRQYQDEDGNYTDEGVRHYRELRKKREEAEKKRAEYEKSDEAQRNKRIARMKSSVDKKALSDAVQVSQDIAHQIRNIEEQQGKNVTNLYDNNKDKVDDAARKVMAGLLLWQYSLFNPGMTAVVRVGDDYIRGNYQELENRFKYLIASGKDISDTELVSADPYAYTVLDMRKADQGIINKWEAGDDEIEKSKKNRTKTDR